MIILLTLCILIVPLLGTPGILLGNIDGRIHSDTALALGQVNGSLDTQRPVVLVSTKSRLALFRVLALEVVATVVGAQALAICVDRAHVPGIWKGGVGWRSEALGDFT